MITIVYILAGITGTTMVFVFGRIAYLGIKSISRKKAETEIPNSAAETFRP